MVSLLARRFRVDVTSDLTLASGWVQLNGITDFAPNVTPNLEDSSAYDTNGWASQEVTFQEWAATATVARRSDNAGVLDPGQALVQATVGQFGTAARVGLRWYDKNGIAEAKQGIALVTVARANTGVRNLEQATYTFSGTDVALVNITNPGVAPTAPLVSTATPAAQSVGRIITLSGQSFTGTTGITIGGVSVATQAFTVESDNSLVFVVPAGTAGSAPIIVTNAVGAGTSFAYTRGA